MTWTLGYARAAERDFELMFEHLYTSYLTFGEIEDEALRHAAKRVLRLKDEIDRLVDTPLIGTLRPDMGQGIRFVRRDQAAVWFLADEQNLHVAILAVFFGAQDHVRHMLVRLLSEADDDEV